MTRPEKIVADYAGISIFEAEELCYYTYRLLLRDGVIHMLSATESGREYLDRCWVMEQTAPDRRALREKYGSRIRERKEAGTDG